MHPGRGSSYFFVRCLLLLVYVSLCLRSAPAADAHKAASRAQTIPGLGTASFATSTKSPEARSAFMRGLLLLHLFEYPQAAEAFLSAETLDPAFTMAYWGEAMTYNHGVWNQLDARAGKAALDKFAATPAERAARTPDAREAAYLATVEILYDGTGSKVERDLRYTKALENLSTTYPDDRNAQLFYALALLGQSESVRDVPVYLHAAEISKAIYRLEPNNPGAAHYWIHGMDDPEHAAGALEAARALSKIAPDAGHAQHMCSHIFMALGMWDDVVTSNLDAIRVVNLRDKADAFPAYGCAHYPEWLEYAFFQQGRLRAARQTLAACERTDPDSAAWMATHPGKIPFLSRTAAALHRRLLIYAAGMRDVAVIEGQDWTSAAAQLSEPERALLSPDAAAWYNFATGYAAAQRADTVEARTDLAAMRSSLGMFQSGKDVEPENLQAQRVGADELSGFIEAKDGHFEAGVAQLRQAAETYRKMAFAFGPPVTIKPPEELLGEVLLAHHDAVGARLAFEQCLQRAPLRAQSLLGLARAERMAGNQMDARRHYTMLQAIWHDADADLPGLDEARVAISPAR